MVTFSTIAEMLMTVILFVTIVISSMRIMETAVRQNQPFQLPQTTVVNL